MRTCKRIALRSSKKGKIMWILKIKRKESKNSILVLYHEIQTLCYPRMVLLGREISNPSQTTKSDNWRAKLGRKFPVIKVYYFLNQNLILE